MNIYDQFITLFFFLTAELQCAENLVANDANHHVQYSSLAAVSFYPSCEEILMIDLCTINLNYFQFTPNIYQQKNCPAEGRAERFVVETESSFKTKAVQEFSQKLSFQSTLQIMAVDASCLSIWVLISAAFSTF